MKKLTTLLACGAFISLHAQTPFFTESFGTAVSCDAGQEAIAFNSGVGTWSVTNTGTNDTYSNIWYVSATESGMGVGNCGDGCLGTGTLNRSLHIGSDPAILGDAGAAYASIGGFCDTDKRAESPTVDCSAYNTISLSFNYLMEGLVGVDFMDVYYSPDNGSSWSFLASPSQTNNASCSPQGLWTAYSVSLPASANNNANVKIGFRWRNSGSGGSDPSVAIDDVVLSGTAGAAATITTGSITGTPFCPMTNFVVPYTVTGTFTAGNVFTAQLSDNVGSFASPTVIGSIASTTSGNISATIPMVVAGTGYLIRVVSSTPAITGTSSAAFTINAPAATASNDGPYCAGETINLMAGSVGVDYDWTGPIFTAPNTQNPTIPSSTPANSGTYTVIVTDAGGCSATATTTVTVNNAPNPTASNTGPYCLGTTIQLNSPFGSSTDDWTGPNSYVQNNTQNPTITGATLVMSGVYTVTVTNGSGCSATATTTVSVIDCSGIEDEVLAGTSIYPNPVADAFTISIPEAMINESQISIISLVGETVYNFTPSQSKNTISTESLGLKSGIYLVQIKWHHQSRVIRLIVR